VATLQLLDDCAQKRTVIAITALRAVVNTFSVFGNLAVFEQTRGLLC